jgi:regulator of protease activity HflC (stomatin/prohibitin superfamily)
MTEGGTKMLDAIFEAIFSLGGYLGAVIIIILILTSAIKIIPEYQRGVVFRLGMVMDPKGPGIIVIIPIVDKLVRVDLRVFTIDVPVQEVITRDNVPIRVNAVVYFRVMDPIKSVVAVENYIMATSLLSQTTLRSVVGGSELDEVLSERERINVELQRIIDERTDPWGIKVSAVEVKELELPDNMKRALAKQAEAERERRAKIINAEGEFQAAETLSQAAKLMEVSPITLQLRYLQTLKEMSSERNATIIVPFPVEFLNAFSKGGAKESKNKDEREV